MHASTSLSTGKTCVNPWCKTPFSVTDEDREMMRKFDVQDDPEFCPDCRHTHRNLFSPRLKLHHRKSDLSGKPILSIYHPRNPFPVYDIKEWWSDKWDPLTYGRDIDWNRSFFDQFAALYRVVPKMANQNENTENCEYSYSCGSAKNVYYSRTVHRSEDVYYSQYITGYNHDICDSLYCQRSSNLHECVQCMNCVSSTYLYGSANCGDCHFSVDLKGCTDCLFCTGLRNKSFHVLNEPVTKEKYAENVYYTLNGTFAALQNSLAAWRDVRAITTWKHLSQENCEHCIGDALTNCKNCYKCFQCVNTEDARYCRRLSPSEKCVLAMDLSSGGIGELLYSCVGLGGGNYHMRMCVTCRLCSDLTYCTDCFSTKDCFGCCGLKNKQYCILNKQYSKEEYERLHPKLIEYMKKSGEWGKFFPLALSPFTYDESNNMDETPLTKEEAQKRGWMWSDDADAHPDGVDHTDALPDSIDDVTDEICTKVLTCTETGKKFKIVPQELAFYRLHHLSLPRVHPDARMERRRKMINPYRLWTRQCMKCHKEIRTSFAPDRPEVVYCEECYLKEVY